VVILKGFAPNVMKGKSKMGDVQELTATIKTLIQEGKSGEEIFQFLSPFFRTNPGTEEGIAERLASVPHEAAVKILQCLLKETVKKEVQRTVKRSLYRLKSKGIPVVEMSLDKSQSILRPPQIEPPKGFGTGIDLHGQRMLMLVIPHSGRGWTVMHGMVSDIQGLINFIGEEMTRREFRGFFDDFRKKIPFPIVEMEAFYVGFLFFRAYQLTLEKKGTPPQDYLRLKGEIEGARREFEQPLIYSYLPSDEIAGDERWLNRGGDLLKDDLFVAWGIEEDRIRPYADAITEAQQSKLFLSQDQKEGRFQEVYLKALTEIFSDEMKALYRRRLEETAYIFHQSGKGEEAKTALSVAMDVEKPLNPIRPNVFLLQLVIRSIFTLLSETREKEKREPSMIIKP